MENSKRIEETAGEWLLERDSEGWSDEGQARLTAWLEAATANRVAFLRLEMAWDEMNRLKALGAGFPPRTVPSTGELSELSGWSPSGAVPQQLRDSAHPSDTGARNNSATTAGAGRTKRAALAAALCVLAIGGAYLYTAAPFSGDRYSTPIGGVTSVPLKDGSSITLNSASMVRVQLSETERRIDLTQGEAFFEVAKDPARPFVVHAGNRRVIAVGTKFSVRRDGDDVRVVVTEGVVRFEDTQAHAAISGAGKAGIAEVSRLTAGAVVRAAGDNTIVRTTSLPEAEDLLSWRSGYVVFHETALADAVAEFNRYNERRIVIRDPQIAAIRLTGKFRSNNFEVFVRLLEESFPIHAQRLPDQIILSDGLTTEPHGAAETP
ncbi:MAG: FecR domain-containing protein [Gammaproteobacteria bacterium]